MARLVLLSSPLLGPAAWRPTLAALRATGHEAEAPAWPSLAGLTGGFYAGLVEGVAAAIDASAGPEPIVVAHSGAGALVPALAARLRRPAAGAIFADAILPHLGRSWFDTAPKELRDQLRFAGQSGWLPAWNEWWPPGALERLLPDEALRADILAEIEPLPIGYFEEPAPDLPLALPAAFLKLSGAYEDEAQAAARMGWPIVRLPLNHLAIATQPQAVASALGGLAGRIATPGS